MGEADLDAAIHEFGKVSPVSEIASAAVYLMQDYTFGFPRNEFPEHLGEHSTPDLRRRLAFFVPADKVEVVPLRVATFNFCLPVWP